MSAHVVSVGARGPLGLSSLQLALCLRAAKLEPRAIDLLDKRGREIGACITGGLSKTLYGYQRMLALAAPALREAVRGTNTSGVDGVANARPLPVVLCLPEAGRPDDDPRMSNEMVAMLAERSGVTLDVDGAHVIRAGHAGGAHALEMAQQLVAEGAEHVLVGGVDTYYHPGVFAWLDANCRLHALDAEDGIVPSEGAAFALLARAPDATRDPRQLNAVGARLLSVATGREETVVSDEANIGATVTELVQRSMETTGGLSWVMSDVNGERHRAREWSMLEIRCLPDTVRQDRFASQLGDIGAAIGPTLLAVACQLWRRGAVPPGRAAVVLHSEGPERGVFALEPT